MDDLGELLKSNVASDALQRIAQGFDLALADHVRKKIKLDSATNGGCAHLGDCRGFGAQNRGGVFKGSQLSCPVNWMIAALTKVGFCRGSLSN